jgi:uncharacterized membrane protein YheB (UPF0754 family)
MNYWMWLFPLFSFGMGWLINKLLIKMLFHPQQPITILGIKIQGVIPKRKVQIAQRLGNLVREDLFSIDDLAATISNPTNVESLTPLIETHLDQFLNVKLATEMPMLSMFISQKTIATLKNSFMAELRLMLPDLFEKYASNLKHQIDLEKIITHKLTAIPNDRLENILIGSLQKEMRMMELLGGFIGFFIGLMLVIIIAFTA